MSTIQPFPGLRPFRSEEDFLFFGREEQVSELLNLLQRHRFLAVVGSSGSGKSSLVRCGLMSQLHGGMMLDAGAQWKVAVMQPGGDPLARLAQSLIEADIYDDDRDDDDADNLGVCGVRQQSVCIVPTGASQHQKG